MDIDNINNGSNRKLLVPPKKKLGEVPKHATKIKKGPWLV
jgi:hypothetical protein